MRVGIEPFAPSVSGGLADSERATEVRRELRCDFIRRVVQVGFGVITRTNDPVDRGFKREDIGREKLYSPGIAFVLAYVTDPPLRE